MSIHRVVVTAALVLAGAAWIAYAEHPTAKNLRAALIETLGLL